VIVSFMPATADNAISYLRILPGLLLIGAGMGICFPAINVGAMGAVAGPEVGLASGILNTARQLGVAVGVAILIATFGGAMHAHMSWFAEDEIEDIVGEWEIPGPIAGQVVQSTLHDYTGGTTDRFEPKPGFDEEIIRQTAGSAREGFAWAFRQAAILILSVLPLMGALRRTPAQAQAEFRARMKAQQEGSAPPDGEGRGAGADGEQAPGEAPAVPAGAKPRPA
jgi:hypothetical protein